MRSLALCLALLASACGSDEATVDAQPAVDAALMPSVTATPNPTTIAAGGTVVLTVATTNFNIINPNGASPKPGEGHYHYYLDDAAMYVAAWTPSVNVRVPPGAPSGAHMIRVVLVTSAHVPVTPAVETTVMFTVQ